MNPISIPFPLTLYVDVACGTHDSLLLVKSDVYKFCGNSIYCILLLLAKSTILSTGIPTIAKLKPKSWKVPPRPSINFLTSIGSSLYKIVTSIKFASPIKFNLLFSLFNTALGTLFNNPNDASIFADFCGSNSAIIITSIIE